MKMEELLLFGKCIFKVAYLFLVLLMFSCHSKNGNVVETVEPIINKDSSVEISTRIHENSYDSSWLRCDDSLMPIMTIQSNYPLSQTTAGSSNGLAIIEKQQGMKYGYINCFSRLPSYALGLDAVVSVYYEKSPWRYSDSSQVIYAILVVSERYKASNLIFAVGDSLKLTPEHSIVKSKHPIYIVHNEESCYAVKTENDIITKVLVWNYCITSDIDSVTELQIFNILNRNYR